MKEFWVSAYTQYGNQFGATVVAEDKDDLDWKFREEYPDCEFADYGCYDDYED